MAKRKRPAKEKPALEPNAANDLVPPPPQSTQIFIGGNASLHDLFQQQVRNVLDQSDLDEQGKQAILVAMNCPCCGAGAMNYTAKINRKPK